MKAELFMKLFKQLKMIKFIRVNKNKLNDNKNLTKWMKQTTIHS